MKVTVAENAGFCFGVKRATERLEQALQHRRAGERLLTLGHLIHNDVYNRSLAERGVEVTDIDGAERLAPMASEAMPVTVFVRAHGIPHKDEARLARAAEANPWFRYEDCTCPFVKKIHNIVERECTEDSFLLVLGNPTHPEVVGILSYFEGEKLVYTDAASLETMAERGELEKYNNLSPVIVSQTTQSLAEWKKSQKIFKKLYTNARIFDTICSVTELRQNEAAELSRRCDCMVVIGGRDSSNTAKLYSICKEHCQNTVWIESPDELWRLPVLPSSHAIVGIAAGASTPQGLIQEVYETMSEMNFEQMLEESLKTLNTGDTVTGTVTNVTDAELTLDLGVNVTGYIKAEQITDDPAAKLTEMFRRGDEVEAFVIRVSDIEGVAELSKKRVDSDRNWQKIVAACEAGEIVEGKVVDIVKGGAVALVGPNRVFIPASQTGVPKDGDMTVLKGTDVKLRIIEIKGNRAIGSIKLVAREERRAAEAAFWASIEEGKVYDGVVKSMTAYGAFIDLGGVDGMVHKTELSWKPIATPADVVAVGDPITVFVKSFDAEKKRISLGYKTEESNPWYIFTGKYAVGDVASVKIVNMMPFGAFAEIVDGVDGLIHISQIAQQRIGKPADVLSIGDVVDAKIIAIDEENRKVSLSIRALLDEAQAEAEAMPEDAEAVADEAVVEE